MESQQRHEEPASPQHDKVAIKDIEPQLKKFGIKLINQTRVWLSKFRKDDDNRIVIKGSKKKLNSYIPLIVILINHYRLKFISLKFDIQTEVANLQIEQPLRQIIESNLAWLTHVKIKEELATEQLNNPPMLITQFFAQLFCSHANNIEAVEIQSNNETTINEIIEKVTQLNIKKLSMTLPQDVSRVRSALKSFGPDSLRQLSFPKSNNPPSITITYILNAIQHIESLEVLEMGYNCRGFQQQVFKSIYHLHNLQRLQFSHPVQATQEMLQKLYKSNTFLCMLKCWSQGTQWSAKMKKYMYAIASREYNYNRLSKMIDMLNQSVLSTELRKDYLLQLCDFIKLVIF